MVGSKEPSIAPQKEKKENLIVRWEMKQNMVIWVLRYGHRRLRDARASTHVALVARALGAAGIIFEGERDDALLERLHKISKEWGGTFEVRHTDDWIKDAQVFKARGGWVAHLTMYGEELPKAIAEVRKSKKDGLIIVGSQKVPVEAYQMADFNISVTTQPHSEIAALALFLDHYFQGRELALEFTGAQRRIVPSKMGKNVVLCDEKGQV